MHVLLLVVVYCDIVGFTPSVAGDYHYLWLCNSV